MRLPRPVSLSTDARAALGQIIGIMSDQAMVAEVVRWDLDHLIELEARLGLIDGAIVWGPGDTDGPTDVVLGIDDAALLLDGMAFTEVASADLPWIDMVRWTADFVSSELRRHWTADEWLELVAGR